MAAFVLFGVLGRPIDARESAPPPHDSLYLWVVRYALEDTVAFAALADSARSVGITDLLVQVRGRGEAYYESRSEPAPRSLEKDPKPGGLPGDRPSLESLRYDPLAAAIRIVHERGMRIHAWFNLFVAGSWNPADQGACHVLRRNPEWQIRLKDGRLPEDLSDAERKRLNLEGIFLDPGHPRVIAYYRGLVRELLWRYAVDGIHFDYVRYPWADAGYGQESRNAFRTAEAEGRIPAVPSDPDLDPWDAWRIERVSDSVEALSRIARITAPAVEVSAAVMPDPTEARRSCMQDWPTWIRRGWCDRVFLMAYTKSTDRLDIWMQSVSEIDPEDRYTVLGVGLHKLQPTSLEKVLDHLRAMGIAELAFFSDVQFMQSSGMRSAVRRFRER